MSHDNGPDHRRGGWREWLALNADLLEVGSTGVAAVSFLFWLIGWLPSLVLALLVGFCLGLFFAAMLAKVFESNNEPTDSIGAHLRTASLEPRRTEALPLSDARSVQGQAVVSSLREARQPLAASSQTSAEEKAEHNLLCSTIAHEPAHEEDGLLVDGHADGDSDVFVYGVKISNKSDPTRRVSSIIGVSAEIDYTPPGGPSLEVLRGSWLSENQYKVDFGVNDEHRLAIVGTPRRITQGAQLVFYFRRESSRSGTRIVDRIVPLGGDSYHVKIRLISEAENARYKELDYRLTIIREPELRIELVEDKEQATPSTAQATTQPDTPAPQVPTAGNHEAVVRRLRGFQTEGRRLLENSVNNTTFRVHDFHRWEEEAETFIRENIGDAQANEFITDDPVIPYRNPYSLLNTAQTNLINTRLDRLSNLISKVQRS